MSSSSHSKIPPAPLSPTTLAPPAWSRSRSSRQQPSLASTGTATPPTTATATAASRSPSLSPSLSSTSSTHGSSSDDLLFFHAAPTGPSTTHSPVPLHSLSLPTGVAAVPAASIPDRLSVALSLTAHSDYGVDSSRPARTTSASSVASSSARSSPVAGTTATRRSPPPGSGTISPSPPVALASPVPLPTSSLLLQAQHTSAPALERISEASLLSPAMSSALTPFPPPAAAAATAAAATSSQPATSLRAASRSAQNLAALAVSSEAMCMLPYAFPTERLQRVQADPEKIPLVLVACGSYSPITYLHLRMFEMALDWVSEDGRFEMLGGYFSPVHDAYGKVGLASAAHRVAMCRLAAQASDWLMVDAWEPTQPGYVRTVEVLDHFHHELNEVLGGVELPDGSRRPIRIMLLAGGDLIESFGTPNLWAEADLHRILGNYGCFIIERTGTDVWAFLLSHDILYEHRRNVFVVKQLIYNDISSTKVRLFVKRNMSIKYLVPDAVMHHIYAHRLYIGEREPPSAVI